MNNASSSAASPAPAVKKSKFIYTLLALLPTGFFGIAEFYIGRRILGTVILAATLLLPVFDTGTEDTDGDPEKTAQQSQIQEEQPVTEPSAAKAQETPKSDLQDLIDFFPTMVAFLYFSSFISGFWYIRNNCQG